MCPECGGDRIRLVEFDFGTCSQTGYHDCGESFQCLECGATGDPDELVDLDQKMVHLSDGEELVNVGETVVPLAGPRSDVLDFGPRAPADYRPEILGPIARTAEFIEMCACRRFLDSLGNRSARTGQRLRRKGE